jgi:hypothetical protein
MAAAANPLATRAGEQVLREGGSAVDAAVAVQAALGLVEPQSSGIGGGAFMTYYDAKTRKITTYNGRETAPMGASPDMFLGPDGKPLSFVAAVTSGRSTGVPGAVAMLHMAQKAHGRLAWKDLFTEAEALADQGFAVTPRLAALAASRAPQAKQPDAPAEEDLRRVFRVLEANRVKASGGKGSGAKGSTADQVGGQGDLAGFPDVGLVLSSDDASLPESERYERFRKRCRGLEVEFEKPPTSIRKTEEEAVRP